MAEQTLKDIMQMGHLIRVREDGTIDDDVWFLHTPESVEVETDENGQILDEHEKAMIEEQERAGWTFFTNGYSGQYRYAGPIMHSSEFIGGGLETDISETPGYYVTVPVDTMPADEDAETESAGWAVLYRETLPES